MSTAMEITMNAASNTVSEVLDGLANSRDEQRRTQFAPLAVVQEALPIWLWQETRGSDLSVGIEQCGNGTLPIF